MADEFTFEKELEKLINKYSMENGSGTPDFILAQFVIGCLAVFNKTMTSRESWYGRNVFGYRLPVDLPTPTRKGE